MANESIQYLTVTEVVQTGPYSIRVAFGGVELESITNQESYFSAVPYLNKEHPNTALRKDVYGFQTGGTSYTVANVTTVPDFFNCIEISFTEKLVSGAYTFTINTTGKNAIKNYAGLELRSQTQFNEYNYTFSEDVQCEDMLPQAKPSSIEDLLRKYMSPVLDGPNFRSLIAALASGEKYNSDTFQNAYHQLFINTAGSPYLERLAAGYGIYQTEGAEMDDDHFRKYVQTFYNKKLTEDALYSMMEVFYGITSTRAHAVSTSETLGIVTEGENKFQFIFDGIKEVTITINDIEFTVNTNRNAAMLIDLKLKEQQVKALCDMDLNGKIRLFSNTKGLRSSVEVVEAPSWSNFATGKKWNLYSNPNPAWIGRDASGVMQIFLPVVSGISVGRDNENVTYTDNGAGTTSQQEYFPTSYQALLTTAIPANTTNRIVLVDDPGVFPNEGKIYIGYGFASYQAGPLGYKKNLLGQIQLETPFTVSNNIPIGAEVNFAVQSTPSLAASQVDPSEAVQKLQKTLVDMIDAGTKHQINIYYPTTSVYNVEYVYS